MNYSGSGVEPVIVIDHLRVIRGKRPAIHDLSVQIARGTITGLLGPSGCGKTTLMRSIVGTQIVTAGTRDGARAPGRLCPAPPAHRLHAAGSDHLQRPAHRRQRALLRLAVRHGRQRRRRSCRRPSASTITELRCAATFPAVNGRAHHWRARWWRIPTCWCSTNPPWALTRCCASTSGSSSTNSPGAERHCWSRAT